MSDSFARRRDDESGVALVIAMLAILIIGGLITVMLQRTVASQRLTGNARDYEIAVHVAEAGLDDIVSHINADRGFATRDGANATVEYDLGANATNAAQKAWALEEAAKLIASFAPSPPPVGIIVTSGQSGEAVAIRPTDAAGNPLNVIFSVVYVPSISDQRNVRVLRLGFDQNQFTPSRAVLTEGDLDLTSSNPGGGGVRGRLGNIHSNARIIFKNSGGAFVDGDATAVGNIVGDTSNVQGAVKPNLGSDEVLPNLNARELYDLSRQFVQCYPADFECATGFVDEVLWYDMCPDGYVRQTNGTTPCTGTVINAGSPGSWKTWGFTGSMWKTSGTTDGVFYGYCVNMEMKGVGYATVIAEDDGVNCPAGTTARDRGNINVNGGVCYKSGTHDLLFVADRDFKMQGSADTGTCGAGFTFEGLIAAGEQVSLTSSSASMRGGVIAADKAAASSVVTSNQISNKFSVTYENSITVPFSALVRTTNWAEL